MNTRRGSDGWIGWAALALTVLGFHVLARTWLDYYYATHLPHYDSMGSYTAMFEIIQTQRSVGWGAAFVQASTYNLSWLQGFFAAVAAPWLEATPSSVQLYNSLCVFAAMAAIYLAGRTHGFSVAKAYAATLCVFVPDVFYEPQGGLADLQRDPSFLLLLTACFFTWFAFSWAPGRLRAVWFGLLCGLTLLSRSSAVLPMMIVLLPPVACGLLRAWRAGRFRALALPLLLGGGVCFLVAGAFMVLRFLPEMARYQNPFVFWLVGDSAIDSLRAHWSKPFELLCGQIFKANSLQTGGWLISRWVFGGGAVLVAVLLGAGIVGVRWRPVWDDRRNRDLLLAGGWAMIVTVVWLCVFMKARELSFPSNKHPFYPSLLFPFSLAFLAIQVIQPGRRVAVVWRATAVWSPLVLVAFVLATGLARTKVKTLPSDPGEIATVKGVAEKLESGRGGSPLVAVVWNEGFSLDTIRFYNAMVGGPRMAKFVYQFAGIWHDFDVNAPSGTDVGEMMACAKRGLLASADIVVVNTGPSAYRNPVSRCVFFREGAGVVRDLLADPRFAPVYPFVFRGDTFVVLRRTDVRRP